MSQEITIAEAGAALTMSLPPRLAALAARVGTVQHPGQPQRFDLPEDAGMTSVDRSSALALLERLDAALNPEAPFKVDDRVYPGNQAKAALLASMVLGLAHSAGMSKAEADAKIEWYAQATEDLPAIAVSAALRNWAQGKCPESIEERPNYAFPPSPATLRKMAEFDLEIPRRRRELLDRLSKAVPTRRAMDPAPIESSAAAVPALRRM